MQELDQYQNQVNKLFLLPAPPPTVVSDLDLFLKAKCGGSVDKLREFVLELGKCRCYEINFDAFCSIVRVIKRHVIAGKNEQVKGLLADFVVSSSRFYFPYLRHVSYHQFGQMVGLLKGLPVREPESMSEHRKILLHLCQDKYSNQFGDRVVEMINNEVLIERKSQSSKNLKMNSFFGQFVAKHIDRLVPQLQRLLVRNQSNLEVWEDFITTIGCWKGMDKQILGVISKIKGLYMNHPESCVKIVNTLTSNMGEQKSIKEVVAFITNLLGSEHSPKRKIVYIRMLQGLIKSIKNLGDEKLRNIFGQDIAVAIANSLIKFTEEEQFNVLIGVVDKVCDLVSEPKDDVAKTLKLYLKNQNKYVLILMGVMMAKIYGKEDVQKLPSVKEIYNHFKGQLQNFMKKAGANWQWLLPVFYFLSESELAVIDNLSEDLPIFKGSCLALSVPEMKIGLKLILKKISFLKNEGEEIQSYIYAISALLLEEIHDESIWRSFVSELSDEQKVHLVSKGLFPLITFGCDDLKKNRGHSFASLLAFLKKQFKKGEKIDIDSAEDFLRLVIVFNGERKLLDKAFQLKSQEEFNEQLEKYVKASLFDWYNDEQFLINSYEKGLIDNLARPLLRYRQNYLLDLLKLFTNEEYYKNDLTFLIDFSDKVLESTTETKEDFQNWKQMLVERSIHKEKDIKPKKIYIGVTMEVKMMSEEEVKQQKYHVHFMKMVRFFDLISQHFLATFNDHQLLTELWQQLMKKLLNITIHAEHRLNILKLIKRSCLYTAWFNRKQKEANIFLKHAQFLGEFFSLRNSGITPSVKLMNRCQTFMKQLLVFNFEEENTEFKMLQDKNNQFIVLLINQMCEYLLKNMEFDVNLKRLAIRFYDKCFKKGIPFQNEDSLFTYIVFNINILSSSDCIQNVLLHLLQNVDSKRYKQFFADILNFIQSTKKLILETLAMLKETYKPEFEEFIKLKILSLESNAEISKLATEALSSEVEIKKSILTFDMKNFVKKNSKETIQKLCVFIKEEITKDTAEAIFMMVLKASQQLFDEEFDQEGLQMLPYFLTLNIEHITQNLFKPVFSLLTIKFTSKEQFGTLLKLCVEVGINIIKRNAKQHSQKLLLVLESFINKASGVSNIIFLGVLAPYLHGNKNLQIIEQRITELFRGNRQADQKAISKCMQDLMSFFKKPDDLVEQIFINIGTMKEEMQIGQSYLFSGLLKGIGYDQTQVYLDKIISSEYVTKTKPEKLGRIHLIHAMVQNFGRVVEIKSIEIISIILSYMADSNEQIRNLARRTGQNLILKMSSFSVKILLPQLLEGLENEQNWRVKISYIWILGVMANCSAKQLQTSLSIIVPSLSTCLSNAHPTIREKSSQALNLIGETIKNPQISQCVDILIEALENPFQNSTKAMDLLLKTSFNHYIDAPSLSMIIPILDYSMRGRNSDMKAGACQVMGSIVELISNPYDLLPYLKIILTGLKISLCDPLPEIRRIASMAIGKISTKIGIKQAEEYFKFVNDIIESSTSNSIERQGAAQAHAEIICCQTEEYFEESLYRLFQKLNSAKHSQKEGYILVFLFVPMIKTQQFEGFIKEVNQNMYSFVSDEDEVIRNSAMLVQKVLINNYCLTHTDLLLEPLCDGAFDSNWKKRNAAIILIGQILNILKSHMYNTRTNDKAYAYYRGLMAVYIIKDDELEMSRATAIQVWNTYIENTPKTIRSGIEELVKMWSKFTHATGGVVFKNIVAFSTKYGETYFADILEYLPHYLNEPEHSMGIFLVLAQFIKRMSKDFLNRQVYRETIKDLFSDNLFVISERVRPALAKCLAIYIDKMGEEVFFQELLYPTISKMDETDETNEEYTYNLHLLKDFLNTNSSKVVDRVINKVMEAPMSEFKIQVITNNAQKLANYLYSHFKRPATEVFVEEILTLIGDKAKENRLNLITYCLEQVSLQLNAKYKTQFIRMIIGNITKLMDEFQKNKNEISKQKLSTFVNMVMFFLNSTPLAQIDDLQIIVGRMSPLVFIGDRALSAVGHKIYMLVITDNKSDKTSEYIRQIRVSFENNVKKGEYIWEDEDILKDYISILVKGVAYGKEEVMEQSLDLLQFMLNYTPRALIQKYILKIVGPVIRISNYPLMLRQKVRIMELLIFIIRQKFKISAYNNQLMSVCLRLLQQFKFNDEIIHIVSDTYYAILEVTVVKKDILLPLLNKLKGFETSFMQTIYYLVKDIVKKALDLPKNLIQKMHEEITAILLHYNEKVATKYLYYASKTSARLGVFLGKPIEKIQSQLKGLTVPYEILLNYLHYAYYKKARITRMESIEVFIRQSSREKVFYLLKSLKLCKKNFQELNKLYSLEYIKQFVPQNLSGFEEIVDVMEDFQSELREEDISGEINEA